MTLTDEELSDTHAYRVALTARGKHNRAPLDIRNILFDGVPGDEAYDIEPSDRIARNVCAKDRTVKLLDGMTGAELAKKEFRELDWIVPDVLCEGLRLVAATRKPRDEEKDFLKNFDQ